MAEPSGPLDHGVSKMKPIPVGRVYSILHRILSVYHFLASAKSTLNEDEIREADPAPRTCCSAQARAWPNGQTMGQVGLSRTIFLTVKLPQRQRYGLNHKIDRLIQEIV